MNRFLEMCKTLRDSHQLNFENVNNYLEREFGEPQDIEAFSVDVTGRFIEKCMTYDSHKDFKISTLRVENLIIINNEIGSHPTLIHPLSTYIFLN